MLKTNEQLNELGEEYDMTDIDKCILRENRIFDILIDDYPIKSVNDLNKLIDELYSHEEIFDRNDKIHVKMKLNLWAFLILTYDMDPVFIK